MFTVREFTATSQAYAQLAEIENAVWPDTPRSGEEMAAMDQGMADAPIYRWIGWHDRRAAGSVQVALETWQRATGRFALQLSVHPAYQGQGLGKRLYEHGLHHACRRADIRELTCNTRADAPRGVKFLEDRGFVHYKTTCLSELRTADYDLEQKMPLRQRALDSGVRIVTIRHLMQTSPDWFAQYHALLHDFQADMMYPPTALSLEEHRREHEADSSYDPDLSFVALVDGDWAAYTSLNRSPADAGLYWTKLTGTRRRFRRLGLASALKVTAIETVQKLNGHTIRTDNDPRNPMYGINVQFGFAALPDLLSFRKALACQAGAGL